MIQVKPQGPGEFEIFNDGVFMGFVYQKGKKWGAQAHKGGTRCIDATFGRQDRAIRAVAG